MNKQKLQLVKSTLHLIILDRILLFHILSCWLSVTLHTNCSTNCTCLGPTVWPTDCPDSSSMWFLSFRTCHVHVRGANNTRKCVGTKIDPSSGSNLLAMSRKKVFLNLAGKLQKLTGVTMSDHSQWVSGCYLQTFFCEKTITSKTLSFQCISKSLIFVWFIWVARLHTSMWRCNPGTFQNHGRPPGPPQNTAIKMVCKTCSKINYLIYIRIITCNILWCYDTTTLLYILQMQISIILYIYIYILYM